MIGKFPVSEDVGEQVLTLRRNQAEAGHFRRRRDHRLVVGVNHSDSESLQAEILRKARHDMDTRQDAAISVGFVGCSRQDAGETWGVVKDRAGVDFVADDVDVLGDGEGD